MKCPLILDSDNEEFVSESFFCDAEKHRKAGWNDTFWHGVQWDVAVADENNRVVFLRRDDRGLISAKRSMFSAIASKEEQLALTDAEQESTARLLAKINFDQGGKTALRHVAADVEHATYRPPLWTGSTLLAFDDRQLITEIRSLQVDDETAIARGNLYFVHRWNSPKWQIYDKHVPIASFSVSEVLDLTFGEADAFRSKLRDIRLHRDQSQLAASEVESGRRFP